MVFLKDIILDMPFSDPKQYAINYYLKYPALTILFYPPLMSFLMAGFYAVFGISHTTAQFSITIFHLALALGTYLLARRCLPKWQAFSASLLLIAAPEICLWGRQVMLDIPACAWLAFSVLFFVHYLDKICKVSYLSLCAFFFLCALYTKQTTIFMAPVFLLVLLMTHGLHILLKKHFWQILILFTLLLIPLILLTMEFGQVNVHSASGARVSDIPRDNVWAWIYYLKQIPHQFGWPTAVLSLIFIVVSVTNRRWRLPKNIQITFLVWLLVGYLFFSAISLRDPRLNLSALLPLPILAVLALNRMLSNISQFYTTLAALFLALSNVGYTMAFRPVPYAQGYAEAAKVVLEKSPNNSFVLFSGQRDGSFIFNMRAFTNKNIGILRADKILLSLSIERSRGYKDRGFDENTIHDLLNQYAVQKLS